MPLAGCLFYTHATSDQVRDAISAQHIIGSTTPEVESKLRRVELNDGRHLEVCRYDPQMAQLCAHLSNASRDLMTTWSINVVVKFDASGHAVSLDVHNSADNPL